MSTAGRAHSSPAWPGRPRRELRPRGVAPTKLFRLALFALLALLELANLLKEKLLVAFHLLRLCLAVLRGRRRGRGWRRSSLLAWRVGGRAGSRGRGPLGRVQDRVGHSCLCGTARLGVRVGIGRRHGSDNRRGGTPVWRRLPGSRMDGAGTVGHGERNPRRERECEGREGREGCDGRSTAERWSNDSRARMLSGAAQGTVSRQLEALPGWCMAVCCDWRQNAICLLSALSAEAGSTDAAAALSSLDGIAFPAPASLHARRE